MSPKKVEKAEKVEKLSYQDAANKVIAEAKGKTTASALAELADAMVVASGGESNPKSSLERVKRALATAEALGVVKLTRPTDILVERLK